MIIYQLNQRPVSDPVYNGAALRRLRSCSTAPPEGYAEAGRARLCVALPGKSGELLLNTRCNPRLPNRRHPAKELPKSRFPCFEMFVVPGQSPVGTLSPKILEKVGQNDISPAQRFRASLDSDPRCTATLRPGWLAFRGPARSWIRHTPQRPQSRQRRSLPQVSIQSTWSPGAEEPQ